jgi:hypothetical protein|nr:MAG TPA: Selenium binding protein [Caudoviricetes sp.]
MKKVLLSILFVGLLTSCVTPKLPEPYGTSTILDYSPLTSKGFYVTESNSVSFDYQAIASVSATEVAGWVKKGKKQVISDGTLRKNVDELYVNMESKPSSGKYIRVSPDINAAMDRMVGILRTVGANGIINLNIQWESSRIIISGMAIRK